MIQRIVKNNYLMSLKFHHFYLQHTIKKDSILIPCLQVLHGAPSDRPSVLQLSYHLNYMWFHKCPKFEQILLQGHQKKQWLFSLFERHLSKCTRLREIWRKNIRIYSGPNNFYGQRKTFNTKMDF